MSALPTVCKGGKTYFFDAKLKELRNTKNPHEVIELSDLEAAELKRFFEGQEHDATEDLPKHEESRRDYIEEPGPQE